MRSRTPNKNICDALLKLGKWAEQSNWKAYDTFDGLSSPYAFLTFGNALLKRVWQQGVRRFPVNLRPVLGIKPSAGSKAMGFFAQGYLNLYQTYGDVEYLNKANFCLSWLIQNRSPDYKGFCWGNHFDYQSRGGRIPKGCPTIVWTGLIGHAFMDAFEVTGSEIYLDVVRGVCEFVIHELGHSEHPEGININYIPSSPSSIHNSSMIGASFLARASQVVGAGGNKNRALELARAAIEYTVHHQLPNGAWYYGVEPKFHWVDSFHTGYVLEALDTYIRYSGNDIYESNLRKGYTYFIETFFSPHGVPRYYDNKDRPIDIQCASQGIQTLVNLRNLDPRSIDMAVRVATWTINNMQDQSGYFYYRKYPLITNKTPTLHWGQATMFAALSVLNEYLSQTEQVNRGPLSDKRLALQ